jgi:hypothetical protein
MPSHLDKIEQLNRLREAGALTRAEFEAEKQRILSGTKASKGVIGEQREGSPLLWVWIAIGAVVFIALAAAIAWFSFKDIKPSGNAYTPPGSERAAGDKLDGAIPLNDSAPLPTPSVTPTPTPSPTATFPQFQSAIPKAFRGNWDEMIADGCAGREPRFSIGATTLNNFEVSWEVTNVKIDSPTEIEISTTTKDEDGDQQDQVWQFRLADGGKSLTSRKPGGTFFRRCPKPSAN